MDGDTIHSEDRYLSLDEVAALAGVHKATVYRWLADPTLTLRERALRLPGGRIRIQESRFREWLEAVSHRSGSTQRQGGVS
jgi:excisionase family DNA binding protein